MTGEGSESSRNPVELVKQIYEGSESSNYDILANHICPSLVMISVYDEAKRWRSYGVGFIVRSNQEYSLVVAPAGFLYSQGHNRELKKGPVVVTMADLTVPEWEIRESDIATVVSVDFDSDLVFLRYKNPYRIKESHIGSFDDAIIQSQRILCVDLHRSVQKFVPRLYEIISDGVKCSCRYGHQQEYQYLHVSSWDPYLPAVILDKKAQIIGFKVGGCSSDNTLSHVMRIDHLQHLLAANLSFPDRDIRFPL